jgi:hypothetical protein
MVIFDRAWSLKGLQLRGERLLLRGSRRKNHEDTIKPGVRRSGAEIGCAGLSRRL